MTKMKSSKYIFAIFIFFLSVGAMHSQCYPDRHLTSSESSWQSCSTSQNPNSSRGNGHWIRYDLGAHYDLGQFHFWNYNVFGETNKGMRNIIIDYSSNGNSWGGGISFTIPQADGTSTYEGVAGPQLNGVRARFVLITALNNHGGSCTGLSELRIGIYEAPCTELVKQIHENPIINGLYHATQSINSEGLVNATSDVEFVAGQMIELEQGFESVLGADFLARIDGCP